ncbi:MAG TPA: MoaD/ThiS family protein [Acidimicrobiales bacterium]|nr:MoaD/ThiS family protein [Acidimicrobiales bacterium]
MTQAPGPLYRDPSPPTATGPAGVRVRLPAQLRVLAGVDGEVLVRPADPVTQRAVLDALEGRYPVLKGTVRDRVTAKRRPFIRFFVGEEDLSNQAPDERLPPAVAAGVEPFVVVGAMAGG